jgi:hypothetical protein
MFNLHGFPSYWQTNTVPGIWVYKILFPVAD